MRKSLFKPLLTGTMALLLISACAEDKTDNKISNSTEPEHDKSARSLVIKKAEPAKRLDTKKTEPAKTLDTKKVADSNNQNSSIMSQPVTFWSPEDVGNTLRDIREQEGDEAYRQVKTAIGRILTKNTGSSHGEGNRYDELNGKTPNEIIAMK